MTTESQPAAMPKIDRDESAISDAYGAFGITGDLDA